MIKKLFLVIAALAFVVSCSSTPEVGEDGKQDQPQNIDSDISFDGVNNPDEDPFFSEPMEGNQPAEVAESEPTPPAEQEVDLPTPTPEPSASSETDFSDSQSFAQEEYEEPARNPEPIPAAEPVARKTPASVNVPDAMRAPDADCSLRAEPGTRSQRLGVAKRGRKIWTENHSAGWFKVYRKTGHAFISKSCFQ